ncbi:MAG: ribosome biogenesis GTPase Der [Pseudomonadota bacterium]|nr:ribosome biogenesis GTPase Der [Pseudomonadota bacterium]
MSGIITLIGRTNVGKSTLFNSLTNTSNAIVIDEPGYTRDTQQGICSYNNKNFIVVDTAGLYFEENKINETIEINTFETISESDLILFLVDAKDGLVALDKLILEKIRKLNKKIYLVVNKIDKCKTTEEFTELGLKNIFKISAKNKSGVSSLADEISRSFSLPSVDLDNNYPSILIIGKPNVGKSTLSNSIIGKNKQLIEDSPGTTRDCIKIPINKYEKNFNIIDTPGIKRKSKSHKHSEKISYIKTLEFVYYSDLVIVLIDATQSITDQDLTLIKAVMDLGKSSVIAFNKTDIIDEYQRQIIQRDIDIKLKFASYIPIFYISAINSTNIKNIILSSLKIIEHSKLSISTPSLNKIVNEAVDSHQPPLVGKKRIRLRYAHQGGNNPIRIIIHGDMAERLPNGYKRYLTNYIRKKIELSGVALFLELRNK